MSGVPPVPPRRPLLAIALLLLPAGVAARTPPDVYILAGQSNMSGRGALSDLRPDERVADPAIALRGNDGVVRPALDPLDDATGQTDAAGVDGQAAVGPGLFFARRMRTLAPARPIELVPCAKGGSSIRRWAPAAAGDGLYDACIARTRAAGSRPAGMLWYQGETDAQSMESAAQWAGRFTALADGFRRDLAAPRLPIVVVQIADRPRDGAARYPGWADVQAAQRALALRCVAVVPAEPATLLPDDLHLDTAAQRALGARLADAMAALHRRGCR